MIFIAHRGNICGPSDDNFENNPETIQKAIHDGYDVEIDIRYISGNFYLGHDRPKYSVNFDFLFDYSDKMWIHCKNFEALNFFCEQETDKFNYIWHQNDDFTLTSKGFIFTRPGSKLSKKSICVMPELTTYSTEQLRSCYAICTDYVQKYEKLI